MKIAIVGSSKATPEHHGQVLSIMNDLMVEHGEDVEFVSGGAKGVDELVHYVCATDKIPLKEFLPKTFDWPGYKARNIEIAEYADIVISIALPFTNKACYHCDKHTHDKTAGCWTMKYGRTLGKPGKVIILNENGND